ncbi:unnamed protein product [Ilex paraguariensis]|uniref:Uncharacterized protein n=1 Tax=Ilex paraguariensis TaxID=185542 RepID=A0ABC8RWF8_9AQUA
MTLAGLQRRGVTSTSINAFVRGIGITRSNLEAGSVIDMEAKKWPDAQIDDASSLYKVPFSNVVYIDHTDFRVKDSKDYYGLAPGKSVLRSNIC